MATIDAVISTVLTDINKVDVPQQVYAAIADTVTLAQLVTALQGYQGALDVVTDGVISGQKISLVIPIEGGVKVTPGPNPAEKGALMNALITGFTNRSYGQNTPAWAANKIVAGQIAKADTAVQTYIALWNATPIPNLGALLSNQWKGLQPFRRAKLNNRSAEREVNSVSFISLP